MAVPSGTGGDGTNVLQPLQETSSCFGAGGNGRGGDGGSWLKKQAKQGTQRSLGVTTGKEAVWSIHRNTSEKVVQ